MFFTVTSGMSCRKSIPAANTFGQHGTKRMRESNGSIMLYYFFSPFYLPVVKFSLRHVSSCHKALAISV